MCVLRGRTFAGIYVFLPRVHSPGIRRDVAGEDFNVFTPPMRRRIGLGMLIASETIVGFLDGMRFPGQVVSYIGNNSVLFQPTYKRAIWAPYCRYFYKSFRAYVRSNHDDVNDRTDVNVRANLKVIRSTKLCLD